MKDQLILYKTAKLAKKKGFIGYEYPFYSTITKKYNNSYGLNHYVKGELYYEELDQTCCDMNNLEYKYRLFTSSQSSLQKWLRETHNIHIEVKIITNLDKALIEAVGNTALKYRYNIYTNINDDENIYECFHSKKTYDTYEEALEDCLLEALYIII